VTALDERRWPSDLRVPALLPLELYPSEIERGMNSQVDAQESNGGVENLRQIVKQLPGKQKVRKSV
jgi:hypothetical protein